MSWEKLEHKNYGVPLCNLGVLWVICWMFFLFAKQIMWEMVLQLTYFFNTLKKSVCSQNYLHFSAFWENLFVEKILFFCLQNICVKLVIQILYLVIKIICTKLLFTSRSKLGIQWWSPSQWQFNEGDDCGGQSQK